MNLKGKNVTVVGLGPRTALPLLNFLLKQGSSILISEKKSNSPLLDEVKIVSPEIEIEVGGHTDKVFLNKDLIIICPGVPGDLPVLQKAREEGIKVWSELELAYRYSKAPFVAITGTNGKSTVTTLVGEYLKGLPGKTVVAGNIGIPLIGVIEDLKENDRIVAEVSSFQLELVEEFKPKVACILNITEDHLDRHHTLENYRQAKRKIFANQDQDDSLFLNGDDPVARQIYGESLSVNKVMFSLMGKDAQYYKDGNYFYRKNNQSPLLDIKDIQILGHHNQENVLAAIAIADSLGVSQEHIKKVTSEFYGLPHVLENLGTFKGVTYINDSKGTNPAATVSAIREITGRKILIAGGQERGASYDELANIIGLHVEHLILFGENKKEIQKEVLKLGFKNINMVDNLEEAVNIAHQIAKSGMTVLFSPASPSWDQYNSYVERGESFRALVNKF